MFDRSKIKKIFFISENRKAIVLNDRALICDEKNRIVKEWQGKDIDLLQIKNQPYVVFTQRNVDPPRDPRARRNAITGLIHDTFFPGQTALMHVDKLEEPLQIPYAVSQMVFMNNKFFGFSCLGMITTNLKEWSATYSGIVHGASDFVPLNHEYMMGLSKLSGRGEVEILHFGGSSLISTLSSSLYLKKICVLTNDQFLAQAKTGELIIYSISKSQRNLLIDLQKQVSFNVFFEEWLLLPDSKIVLGRAADKNLYVIHSETLQVREIDIKAKEPIIELNISENNRVVAVLESGNFLFLDDKILKHSYANEIFLEETTQPTVLIDMIVNYAADYGHLFKNIKKPEEKQYSSKQNMI